MKQVHLLLCLLLALAVPAAALVPGDAALGQDEFAGMVLSFLAGGEGAPTLAGVQDAAALYLEGEGAVAPASPPARVVVFNGETLETLRSLGIGPSSVVGIDKFSAQKPEFFPEYGNTTVVGSIWSPDYETVVSLHPDAVFLYATTCKEICDEIQAKLAASNPEIRVYRFDCFRPENYADDVRALGTIFGREAEAERFAAFYTGALDTVRTGTTDIPDAERTTVYLENWRDYKTGAAASGYEDKIVRAGGKNVFSSLAAEYPEVDPEAVIAADPDVVVKLIGAGSYVSGGYQNAGPEKVPEIHAALAGRPGWTDITAVKEKKVYLLHNDIFGGPENFIGIAYLAKWSYPDRFADLDPAALHQTYLDEYQHLETDLSGMQFTYPAV
ncbi:ABC transporter substrate-binding protein [uncultured Methanofollis sp.]|uniref:ABC transporter substrate-binding protein n=1 Tax=uncultured Methanofollis sp. TaxID=262500 RepID=UPI00261CFF2F|nr:ABC transporter substrate-binding protein [uncultured Methanofollis sp.]